MRAAACLACLLALLLVPTGIARAQPPRAAAPSAAAPILVADDGKADAADKDDDDDDREPSPEERMERRFPQPVRVGFLIGLPLLDWGDSTIGFIRDVVRTPDGKIKLIVPVGGWFFGYGGHRPVAVPLEVVAILARQVDTQDLSREQIEALPTWDPSQGQPIDRNEMIRIALARR